MTTKLFISGMLLFVAAQINAQTTATSTATTHGLSTGQISGNNAFFGYEAGKSTTGSNARNTFIGHQSGKVTTTGTVNTFLGNSSGFNNTTGGSNVFLGMNSGYTNINGSRNAFLGYNSGFYNTGSDNTFLGYNTGFSNTSGIYNTYNGSRAGFNNTSGSNNVFLGTETGFNNILGSGNIFLGYQAGAAETGSNKLYIANSSTTSPMIFGDFATSKVGIGGMNSFPTTAGSVNVANYKLFVKGGILTEEVRVNLATGWADYVFANDYKLLPLSEVEKYIADNGHLPNVPSAKQVKEDGIELGQMANIQQEKIEELTLYVIGQNKQIEEQQNQLDQQQKEIEELKVLVKTITDKK